MANNKSNLFAQPLGTGWIVYICVTLPLGVVLGLLIHAVYGGTLFLAMLGATAVVATSAPITQLLWECRGKDRLKAVEDRSIQVTIAIWVLLSLAAIFSNTDPNGRVNPLEIVTGIIIGTVGAISAFIGLQVFAFGERLRHVEKHVDTALQVLQGSQAAIENLNKLLQTQIAQIAATAHEVTVSGVGAVEKLLDLSQTLAPDKSRAMSGALGAIGLKFGAWWDQIHAADKSRAALWTEYLTTYHREEAFDVVRGELVTNARVGLFLVLATLARLLEEAKESGQSLVVRFVTPVHPKDWYNWPHGADHHDYYENPHVALYHRSFAELIAWSRHNHPNRVDCARYFLSLKGNHGNAEGENKKRNPSWRLESEDDYKSLAELKMINVSVPLSSWPTSCKFVAKLKEYYDLNLKSKAHPVVPMWNDAWAARGPTDEHKTVGGELKTLWTNHEKNGCNCAQKMIESCIALSDASANAAIDAIERALRDLKPPLPPGLWEGVKMSVTATANYLDFPEFISQIHALDVLTALGKLSDSDPKRTSEIHVLIEELLHSTIRRRAASRAHNGSWTDLGRVFRAELHEPAGNVFYVSLTGHDAWAFPTPEFYTFALKKDGVTKLVAALSMDVGYSFDATKVRICMDDGKLKEYEASLESLQRHGPVRI